VHITEEGWGKRITQGRRREENESRETSNNSECRTVTRDGVLGATSRAALPKRRDVLRGAPRMTGAHTRTFPQSADAHLRSGSAGQRCCVSLTNRSIARRKSRPGGLWRAVACRQTCEHVRVCTGVSASVCAQGVVLCVLRVTDISVSLPLRVSPFSHSVFAPVALTLLVRPPHRQPRPVAHSLAIFHAHDATTARQEGDTYMYTFRHDASGWRCDANI